MFFRFHSLSLEFIFRFYSFKKWQRHKTYNRTANGVELSYFVDSDDTSGSVLLIRMSAGDWSSDEDLAPDYVPYAERTDWADVTPIAQDDGQNPVVLIAYSEKCKQRIEWSRSDLSSFNFNFFSFQFIPPVNDVYNYFRAILSTQEKSLRALDLTKDALRLNAANYTVWQYRRDIINALHLDLETELAYSEEVIVDNPKNYQVWHHRRVIVEWSNDPSKELKLTEEVLVMDAKNYHAWQHRQWAIKTYK